MIAMESKEEDWTTKKIEWTLWKKWENREKDEENITNPGIYVLSITEKEDLENKEVNYSDVNYIGMTNSKEGLKQRLNNFDTAIKKGHGHSGGNRIYKEKGKYDSWKKSRNLYVAYNIMKECKKTIKEERDIEDLIEMGKCAYLEYKAMSEFKEQMKKEGKEIKYQEPIYNKK